MYNCIGSKNSKDLLKIIIKGMKRHLLNHNFRYSCRFKAFIPKKGYPRFMVAKTSALYLLLLFLKILTDNSVEKKLNNALIR